MERLGHDHSGYLDQEHYELALSLAPMLCIDLLVVHGSTGEAALIVRDDSQGDQRYALVGGGVFRGETLNEAATRHLRETLGEGISWSGSFDRVPDALLQYFPYEREGYGIDARKHSVGLTYLVEIEGETAVGGEANQIVWFQLDALPRRSQFGFRQWLVVEDLLGLTLAD